MAKPILVEVIGDASSLEKALGVASTKTQQFGKNLQQTGKTLTTHLTLPIALAGAAAVHFAADFDSSMAKIQGLVGASTKQMEVYRKSILALAPTVAQGPKALADALYFVTSSGFKGAQALDILRQSAKASTAGLGDTQQIADLVTSAMTAYGAKTLDAAHATDILVAATKAGKGDPQQFAQALQLNVAAADTLGISFDQLAAATAALSTVNSNVAEDATQLSGIMSALIKPSAMATKQLHKMGLTADELRKEVKDKGLLTTLLDLKKQFHGNIDEIGKLFPNVRGLRGFLTLVGKAAQKNVSIFDQVAHSTGDLNKAFKTALTKDPTIQWQKLTAQLQVLAIVIGEQLIPILLTAAGWVTSLATSFGKLSPGMQHAVLLGVAFLAVLGPLVGIIGTIITVATAAAAAFTAMAAGEFLAAGPIAVIVLAVIALGVALVIAYQKSKTFRTIVNAAFNAIKAVAGAVVGFISDHWKQLVALIPGIGPILFIVVNHFKTFKSVAGSVLDFVKGHFQTVVNVVKSLWSWIQTVIGAIGNLGSALESIPSSILDKLGSVVGSIPGIGHVAGVPGAGGGVRGMGPAQGRPMVIHLQLDGKTFYSAMVNQDKISVRQTGRSLLA